MAFTAILVLHKHRLIVLRRAFSISGSIFLLRCLTMVVTSLSVPGKHLECKAMSFGETWEEKLGRAWEIGSKFGMTTAGVKTCGDYMFSGHTVAVTLLNFLVTEYVDGGGVKGLWGLLLLIAHKTGMLRVVVFWLCVCAVTGTLQNTGRVYTSPHGEGDSCACGSVLLPHGCQLTLGVAVCVCVFVLPSSGC